MKPVVVFDVNETLLDMRALDPLFKDVFGRAEVRKLWFRAVLHESLVANALDRYRDFGSIAQDSLEKIAEAKEVRLTLFQRKRILARLADLPTHEDVPAGLALLCASGYRMAAFSNSGRATLKKQLRNAGIDRFFSAQLSVESSRRFKPAREAYLKAASELGVPIGSVFMVAAHSWDTAGAQHAGARAAYVRRPGMVFDPGLPKPDVEGRDLTEVAARIVRATMPLWDRMRGVA